MKERPCAYYDSDGRIVAVADSISLWSECPTWRLYDSYFCKIQETPADVLLGISAKN